MIRELCNNATASDELKRRISEHEAAEAALQEKTKLAKYLSPQVYTSISAGRHPVEITSRRKKLSVCFCDIADFTETAERLESEEVTEILNRYLTEMTRIGLQYGATIDKYIGDGILLFFGDPETSGVKEDALACTKMAIAMQKRLRKLQAEWEALGVEAALKCRIGISTGYCTVGNFGSEERMEYTIIGRGVNLASRLETAAAPGDILISHETYAQVKGEICCEERPRLNVKGAASPVASYRVVGLSETGSRKDGGIRALHTNIKLDVDLPAMSATEREGAAEVSEQTVSQSTEQSESD